MDKHLFNGNSINLYNVGNTLSGSIQYTLSRLRIAGNSSASGVLFSGGVIYLRNPYTTNTSSITYTSSTILISLQVTMPSFISNGNSYVNGDLYIGAGHNIYEYSDIRLKLNIIILLNSLNNISKLNGISFNWKDSNQKDYGLIAQLILKIIPLAVKLDKNGIKSINYMKIIPFLLLAIKQLNLKVEWLSKKLEK